MLSMSKRQIVRCSRYQLVLRSFPVFFPNIREAETIEYFWVLVVRVVEVNCARSGGDECSSGEEGTVGERVGLEYFAS